MMAWVLYWEDRDGPRVFELPPEYDISNNDEVYVFKSGRLVGPFTPLMLSNSNGNIADEGGATTRVGVSPEEDELWFHDGFKRGTLPDHELDRKHRDIMQQRHALDTVEPSEFFEEERETDAESETAPSATEPDGANSLQDVVTHAIDAEGRNFSGQTVIGGKTLQDVSLRGAILTDTEFDGETFLNVSLRDVDFRGADLQGVTFRGPQTQLAGASFDGADLRGATFEVSVAECSFRGAQLRQADFRDAILQDADFSEAKLKRARFDGTRPKRATFDGATLQNLRASGATFVDASFVSADLRNTIFEGTKFEGVDFTEASLGDVTFDDCTLSDVTFRAVNAPGLQLSDHTASQAEDLDFERGDLAEAEFSRTSFEAARFDNALLSGARFDGCNLSGASLNNVKADGADFSQANLESATLVQADLTNATFDGARLYTCQLDSVRVGTETRFDEVYDYEDEIESDARRDSGDTKAEEDPHRKAASVYRSLEAVYRDNSLTAESLQYHRKRKRASRQADAADGKRVSPIIDLFMEMTTDHGTRVYPLIRVSLITVGLWAAGYVLFGLLEHSTAGHLALSGGDTGPITAVVYAILFSALSFTGLGYGQFTPLSPIGTLLASLETALGILAFGLLIFVLSTRGSR